MAEYLDYNGLVSYDAALQGRVKDYVDSKVDTAVTSAYTVKGSVASAQVLPTTGNTVGDVYNCSDTGMNYVWDGTEWDALGATVDLSAYLKSADAADLYQPIGDYASADILYAGSSEQGGAATTALKLSNTSAIGSATKPVYFTSGGVPATISYTIEADVPSGAVFTDTTYTAATSAAAGLMSAADKAKLDGIDEGASAGTGIDGITIKGTDGTGNASPTDEFTFDSGSNIAVAVSSTGGTITLTAPTASSTTVGYMSTSDYTKLAGITTIATTDAAAVATANATMAL